ncbi:THO complex subunit 2 [Vitis vinifera]|uniref:THO complex subunit 2 n=1 Tax=Vitis vinifera TaxID=29760 RepID=A0A438DGL3_VITVI|nr:THO complex subunit 2 [Vitis vinifera]
MSLPPIECIHVTDDCLREWKSGNPSFKVSGTVPMLRFLYELCSTLVRGELPLHKCKVALDSVEFSDKEADEELASNFADIVTQMALDRKSKVRWWERYGRGVDVSHLGSGLASKDANVANLPLQGKPKQGYFISRDDELRLSYCGGRGDISIGGFEKVVVLGMELVPKKCGWVGKDPCSIDGKKALGTLQVVVVRLLSFTIQLWWEILPWMILVERK